MRAFLSSGRGAEYSTATLQTAGVTWAEREARAILAETEPDPYAGVCSVRYLPDTTAYRALADALNTFLSMEIS